MGTEADSEWKRQIFVKAEKVIVNTGKIESADTELRFNPFHPRTKVVASVLSRT